MITAGLVAPMLLLGCDSDEEAPPADEATVTTVPSEGVTATPIASGIGSPRPTLSPVPVLPGYSKYRWGNVTVVVPEDVISVGRWVASEEENPPDGGLVINLVQGDIVSASVLIDASDGRVVRESENLPPELRDAIATVRVNEPLEDALPWPLADFPPEANIPRKEVSGQIRFLRPQPESGIELYQGCGEAPNGGGCFVEATDGRSRLFVDSATGAEMSREIAAEDSAAFDRWLASVERVTP
jgi:hypothetical protein